MFYSKEQTVYYITKALYSSKPNFNSFITCYFASYQFTFYKPLIYDTYNVKEKYLTFEPDWV